MIQCNDVYHEGTKITKVDLIFKKDRSSWSSCLRDNCECAAV